jgi:hypothetical protein
MLNDDSGPYNMFVGTAKTNTLHGTARADLIKGIGGDN